NRIGIPRGTPRATPEAPKLGKLDVFGQLSGMERLKGLKKRLHRSLSPHSATASGGTGLVVARCPDDSSAPRAVLSGTLDVSLDTSITTFKGIKEISETIPTIGGPLKATCGVMRCKDNRERWRDLAEIMEEKNQRVVSLLGLYAQAPGRYVGALDQANRYQRYRILNKIATDMKEESQENFEENDGLERYWQRMKQLGKEASLSRIKAEKIASYKKQLSDQALNAAVGDRTLQTSLTNVWVQEAVGIRNAMTLEEIRLLLTEKSPIENMQSPKAVLKPRPPLVEGFVGRDDILDAMRRTHFDSTSSHRQIPILTVLTGLGGSGKTQISLKFAADFERQWVPFTSFDSQFTKPSQVSRISYLYTDVLLWLAMEKKNWLIIMDNVDDPSVELPRFLPRCSHGHVIITTRNHLRKTLAPKSTHIIDSLPLDESINLLLTAAGYEDNNVNRKLAGYIVRELGCLPLAISHAAAYILMRQCLDTYLDTYINSRKHLLERRFELSHDYPYSVATTIEMSLEKLSTGARDLIKLLSHLGSGSVPRSIIENGANNRFQHVPITAGLPPHDETLECANVLMSIVCPSGSWSSFDFDNMIEECERYSLIRLSTLDAKKFYTIHVLVQGFVQSAYGIIRCHLVTRLVVRLLGSTITQEEDKYLLFNQLAPCLRRIDLEAITEIGDHYGFGYILLKIGEGRLASSHMRRCFDAWTELFGDESDFVMLATEGLARSYNMTGNQKEGLRLREEATEKLRRIRGEDHHMTLLAKKSLARSYSSLGRYEEALALDQEVVDKIRKVLGVDHPDTLNAMKSLAISYSHLGRHEESLSLDEIVVKMRRNTLGEANIGTLSAMGNLAYSYLQLGRYEEALRLNQEVLEKSRMVLGEEHPDTLKKIENLARCYSHLDRHREAVGLYETIVEARKKSLGEEHPRTIRTMANLARSYSKLGRNKEALMLNQEVLEKSRKVLGEEHLSTLDAMKNLAGTYSCLGRYQEALTLDEKVVEKRRKALGDENPKTLRAMIYLSHSNLLLGRHQEALQMSEEILEKRRKILGDDHPDTLKSMKRAGRTEKALRRSRSQNIAHKAISLQNPKKCSSQPKEKSSKIEIAF
ncbi:15534_t:CDS:2, partial [Acaulospora colombiana]